MFERDKGKEERRKEMSIRSKSLCFEFRRTFTASTCSYVNMEPKQNVKITVI